MEHAVPFRLPMPRANDKLMIPDNHLIVRNPADGSEITRVPATAPDLAAGLVERSREMGRDWSTRPIRERVELVRRWWSILSRDAETLADAIRDEIGKPLPEARMEVTATLDALRWIVKYGRSTLADSWISPGWQRFALMGAARLRWTPLGVVGILGTWNYPLYLDATAIAGAMVAGNGVAWKPSEQCIGVADRLRSSLAEAGVMDGLVATLVGGPEVGRALTEAAVDKVWFTGGMAIGRKIAERLAARGVPMVAELSGYDPAIVLPDSPIETTTRALAWASFVGAGQTCVAVKRVYIVGEDRPWANALASLARNLRVGNPARPDVDLGPMISERARESFHRSIESAVCAGAEMLAGGSMLDGPGWFYRPTVLRATDDRPERILEGVFGPVVVVRGVRDDNSAVQAANSTVYGLAASVWGRDRRRCRAVAVRLEAGMVAINDAVTPSGLAGAPFGGVKGSGFGRVRGALGLREFASPQVLHERGTGGFRPHLFPYSGRLTTILGIYRRLFHPRA